MFNDVDETVRQFLIADVPVDRGEVDISFERPTREWSGRLSKPTLNLFLYDIRERPGYKDMTPVVKPRQDHSFTRSFPMRRIDLSYMVTAWAREPEDEHRILGRVLASLMRTMEIPDRFLQGYLVGTEYPLLSRVMAPEHVFKPVDLWGVLDNDLRACLVFVVTTPLDALRTVEGPLVRTVEFGFEATGDDWRESYIQIGGVAHRRGDPETVLAGATVRIVGSGVTATTDDEGRFSLGGVPRGEHLLHAISAEGAEAERPIIVPSESYDIEL